jgi:hypothetical protein
MRNAFWVIGGNKPGSNRKQWAFATKEDALKFIEETVAFGFFR